MPEVVAAPFDDPQVAAVYAAEDEALSELGPMLRRWADVVAFAEAIVCSPDWVECPVGPPIEIGLERRSRSATFAAASYGQATIWIPDGQWSPHTVVHELSHLLAPAPEAHGPWFCGAELWLARRVLGFDAYGALRSAFDSADVRYEPDWPSTRGQRLSPASSS